MKSKRIAVILACYNRKEKTLRCLKNVFAQSNEAGFELDVYLLDDASQDGTGNSVREAFPSVNVLTGTGNLYWNGGMRVVFQEAMNRGYNYYLWLNDDVELNNNAIDRLFSVYERISKSHGIDNVIVGSMSDPMTGKTSYGGINHSSRIWTLSFEKIIPHCDIPRECETMNGNLVLIPSAVVDKVGNLAPYFTHKFGDLDYGIRVRKAGMRIFISPGHLGTCESNNLKGSFNDPELSTLDRWKIVNTPLGIPVKETLRFCYLYRGLLGVLLGLPTYHRLVNLQKLAIKKR